MPFQIVPFIPKRKSLSATRGENSLTWHIYKIMWHRGCSLGTVVPNPFSLSFQLNIKKCFVIRRFVHLRFLTASWHGYESKPALPGNDHSGFSYILKVGECVFPWILWNPFWWHSLVCDLGTYNGCFSNCDGRDCLITSIVPMSKIVWWGVYK